MKKIVRIITCIILIIALPISAQAATATIVQKTTRPDYYIWFADQLLANDKSINGSIYGNFRKLQQTVYQRLGEEIARSKGTTITSGVWSYLFNSNYRDYFIQGPEHIYEIILIDYLKYGASNKLDSTDLLGSEFKFASELYSILAKDLSNNTIDYIDKKLSVEEAEKIWKNAKVSSNINNALKKVGTGKKTVKTLIEEVSQYLALQEVKEYKITLLKASYNACKDVGYRTAVNKVINMLSQTEVLYAADRSIDRCWELMMDKCWKLLEKSNPVLKAVGVGVKGLDACFDTSKAASNNLKVLLLYLVDSYMQQGLHNSFNSYSNGYTTTNAKKFSECFEGYVVFQQFGNTYAKSWLKSYLNDGSLKRLINIVFAGDNISKANDLINLANTQINSRNSLLNTLKKYSQIYKSKYPITKKVDNSASIKLSSSEITIYNGKSYTLKATVTGKSKTVSWTTSNKSVATVNNKGVISTKGVGKCEISATANGKTAKCTVTVKHDTAKIINVYNKFVINKKHSFKCQSYTSNHVPYYFLVIDIDSDGIPELITADEGGCTNKSSKIKDHCHIQIYKYQKGNVVLKQNVATKKNYLSTLYYYKTAKCVSIRGYDGKWYSYNAQGTKVTAKGSKISKVLHPNTASNRTKFLKW